VQFADQRLFGPLAGIELAAGKFPQARERLPSGRCAISTRLSASISAQATTRFSFGELHDHDNRR
jgi:hypothetical protein